jgi:hypothetical protein
MRVNRTPIAHMTLVTLLGHCPTLEFVVDTIPAENLDSEGRVVLAGELVEGQPAEGITLHGTRWGRKWCAYRRE